jgi:5-methyltetrahydropteroyltriglutamate--homocysteine methyltransferase
MQSTAPGQPPSRADHIGSLLRPKTLRDALRLHAAGEFSDAALRTVQDTAVRDAVRGQEECGLEVITDGEFRRASYWERFVRLTRGLVVKEAMLKFHDEHGHESDFTAPYVAGKVTRAAPITADEYGFLKSATARTAKITMPAPSTMHFYRYSDYGDPRAYREPEEFFADLGRIYRQEIADLAAAGCRYVQLDEVAIAILCDPAARARVSAQSVDPDRLVDLYIDAINLAVADAPPELKVGVHVCRGNYKGMYLSEGGYDSVAERFFARTRVSHFLLEFDTARAGGFAPLRFVPAGKGVVLGLISSKTPQLEAIDVLRTRVDEAARHVDGARLALSPQCGFASTMGGNPIGEADQWAKLRLCVQAARAIWC